MMYVLHAMKLKLWLRSNPVSIFFITQIGHTPGFSNSKQGPSEDLQKIGPLFSCQWYRELQGIYLYPSLRSFNVNSFSRWPRT